MWHPISPETKKQKNSKQRMFKQRKDKHPKEKQPKDKQRKEYSLSQPMVYYPQEVAYSATSHTL